jgi:hypothetical protein
MYLTNFNTLTPVVLDNLLALKTEYKSATGKDWKPDQPPVSAPSTTSSTNDAGNLNEQIIVLRANRIFTSVSTNSYNIRCTSS